MTDREELFREMERLRRQQQREFANGPLFHRNPFTEHRSEMAEQLQRSSNEQNMMSNSLILYDQNVEVQNLKYMLDYEHQLQQEKELRQLQQTQTVERSLNGSILSEGSFQCNRAISPILVDERTRTSAESPGEAFVQNRTAILQDKDHTVESILYTMENYLIPIDEPTKCSHHREEKVFSNQDPPPQSIEQLQKNYAPYHAPFNNVPGTEKEIQRINSSLPTHASQITQVSLIPANDQKEDALDQRRRPNRRPGTYDTILQQTWIELVKEERQRNTQKQREKYRKRKIFHEKMKSTIRNEKEEEQVNQAIFVATPDQKFSEARVDHSFSVLQQIDMAGQPECIREQTSQIDCLHSNVPPGQGDSNIPACSDLTFAQKYLTSFREDSFRHSEFKRTELAQDDWTYQRNDFSRQESILEETRNSGISTIFEKTARDYTGNCMSQNIGGSEGRQILSECFQEWKAETIMSTVARGFHRMKLLNNIFKEWQKIATSRSLERETMQNFIWRRLYYRYFLRWKRKYEKAKINRLLTLENKFRLRSHFAKWKEALIRKIRNKNIQIRALRAWRIHMASRSIRQQQKELADASHRRNIYQRYFQAWKCQCRLRKSENKSLLAEYFHRILRFAYQSKRHDELLTRSYIVGHRHRLFLRWKRALNHQRDVDRAMEMSHIFHLKSTFLIWRSKQMARSATKRACFNSLRMHSKKRKIKGAMNLHAVRHLRGRYFSQWLHYLRSRKAERHYNTIIIRKFLAVLILPVQLKRINELREAESQVIYQQKLKRRFFGQWIDAIKRQRELRNINSLADSQRRTQILFRFFTQWFNGLMRLQQSKATNRLLLQIYLRKWSSKARMLRAERHFQRVIAFQTLVVWKRKAMSRNNMRIAEHYYKAVFSRKKILRCLILWRNVLRKKQEHVAMIRQLMQSKILDLARLFLVRWKELANQRKQLRFAIDRMQERRIHAFVHQIIVKWQVIAYKSKNYRRARIFRNARILAYFFNLWKRKLHRRLFDIPKMFFYLHRWNSQFQCRVMVREKVLPLGEKIRLRRAFLAWSQYQGSQERKRQLSLHAEAHNRIRLMKYAFRKWKIHRLRKQLISVAENYASRRKRLNSLRQYFTQWHRCLMRSCLHRDKLRIFQIRRETKLLHKCLRKWHISSRRSQHNKNTMMKQMQIFHTFRKRLYLEKWRRAFFDRIKIKYISLKRTKTLKERAFIVWIRVLNTNRQIMERSKSLRRRFRQFRRIYYRRLLFRFFDLWKRSTALILAARYKRDQKWQLGVGPENHPNPPIQGDNTRTHFTEKGVQVNPRVFNSIEFEAVDSIIANQQNMVQIMEQEKNMDRHIKHKLLEIEKRSRGMDNMTSADVRLHLAGSLTEMERTRQGLEERISEDINMILSAHRP